jgi:hypothetical protein
MQSTGTNKKKTGYLVALLLVVGLTGFSNSMRELAEVHRFTLETSHLIAQYFVPAEIPQTAQIVVAKLESCESKRAEKSVEIQWLDDVEGITEPGEEVSVHIPRVEVKKIERRERAKSSECQLATLNKFRQFDFGSKPFEFKVSSDDNDEIGDQIPAALPITMTTTFRAKNRKHNVIKLNPRDREMILKTLNRSINLRIAS